MSQFTVKLSGNPCKMSILLNVLDVVHANNLYPQTCLDGYHFEDVTLLFDLDEANKITLLNATPDNVRSTLNTITTVSTVTSIHT